MRNFRSSPAQRRDHYQELTDKIIAALEAGTAPWRRPWDKTACGGATAPVNAATGHRYRGINLFVLGISPLTFASNDSRWCSYRQAAARGWQVRKGEKATPVYFYKPIEIEDKRTMASGRRGASRSCARSRSFTPPRSMESRRLRLRWRRRLWPSGSRTSRSYCKRAASLSGSAGTGPSTTRLSISSRCLWTKLFTARNSARQHFFMNCLMRAVTPAD